jgi:hypothetical protein
MTRCFSPVDTTAMANVNYVKYTFLLKSVYSKVECYLQFALESDPSVLPVINWHYTPGACKDYTVCCVLKYSYGSTQGFNLPE